MGIVVSVLSVLDLSISASKTVRRAIFTSLKFVFVLFVNNLYLCVRGLV